MEGGVGSVKEPLSSSPSNKPRKPPVHSSVEATLVSNMNSDSRMAVFPKFQRSSIFSKIDKESFGSIFIFADN